MLFEKSKETCEKCWILKYFRYYPFSVFAWVEGRPGREAVSLAGVSFDHKEIQGEVVLALLHVLELNWREDCCWEECNCHKKSRGDRNC